MRTCTLLLLLAAAGRSGEGKEGSAFRFPVNSHVKHSVDLKEVKRAVRVDGDPRDVIPTIRKPRYAPASEATGVLPSDPVLGMVVNGEARAYPLTILMVHELVNDVLGGVPIAPSY